MLLIFVLHAAVFSMLLLSKAIQNEHKPSYWLSAFIFFSGLYISPFMLGYAGWYSRQPYRDILFYFPFQQLFLLPPVLYIYVKTLLDESFTFNPRHFLHFLPWFGYFVYSLIVFVTDKAVLDYAYFYADGMDKDFSSWYQITGFISLATYSILCLRSYFTYKELSLQTVSFADAIMFGWIKRFLIALLMILILRGLFFILNPEWDQFGKKFWYYLSFSILVYYISISGYVNAIQSIFTLKTASVLAVSSPINEQEESQLLKTASFIDIDIEPWKNKLEALMINEKIYENPTLTLVDVAQQMETSPKRVSQIINQGYEMNFNDFVNLYRTLAVIEQIKSGNHSLLTLLAIAFECGFNSKSTFNRAFKKHTKLTPKEYLSQNYY
ncbi:helix-turn-helix domain-containing protein [Dyadobacter psychrotolerans]|nr:AraC family transcriptional regulator [Dyadobacter psychrotolerans]